MDIYTVQTLLEDSQGVLWPKQPLNFTLGSDKHRPKQQSQALSHCLMVFRGCFYLEKNSLENSAAWLMKQLCVHSITLPCHL